MSVVIETTLGDITVDLFLDKRPVTCLNFLKLCKMKYYNYNLFHSIRSGFIAQTGDPTGEGSGGQSVFGLLEGPEKRFFSGEKLPKIRHTNTGTLSMVCTGDMMVGSQFFFTLAPDLDSLDSIHCVIGEVTEGHDILRMLNDVICDEGHRPYRDVRITHTVVLEDPFNDPPGLRAPSRSPSPSAERLKGGRIAPDEDIDETQGKTAEEIQEMIEDKEAKARATILEIVGDLPDADIAPPENVLFVCKLNPVTTDEDLEIIFSRFGKIVSCEVIRDKKTGDSLQYAFIEFSNKKSCEDAYFKMDNVLIDDRRIHVDFSQSVSRMRWLGKGRGVQYFNEENKHENPNYKKRDIKEKDNKNGKFENHHRNERRYDERNKSREQKHDDRVHKHDQRSRDRHNRHRDEDRSRRQRSRSRSRREEPSKTRDKRDSRAPQEMSKRDRNENDRHIRAERSKDDIHEPSRERNSSRNLERSSRRQRSRSKEATKNVKDRSRSREKKRDNLTRKERSISRERLTEKSSRRNRSRSREKVTEYSKKEKSMLERSPKRDERKNEKRRSRSRSRDRLIKNSERSKVRSMSPEERNKSQTKEISQNNKHKNAKTIDTYKNNTDKSEAQNHSKNNIETDKESTPIIENKKSEKEKGSIKEKNKKRSRTKDAKKKSKRKRKPSSSTSDSDSSSSSESSSSSDDGKRKKSIKKRKKKVSTSSSSSTSSSTSTSSSSDSSSSSSSSDSEPSKKKRKRKVVKGKSKKKL